MSESKPFSHFYFSGGIPNYLYLQHVLLSALSLYLKRKSQNQLILSIVLRNLLGLLCTCKTETLPRKQLDFCSHQTVKELF